MSNLLARTAAGLTMAGLLSTTAFAQSACPLDNGPIKHIVVLQFDNVHLTRDNPRVPSDLEQMPHLLNFIRSNGVLGANDHTQLISHTAGGIITTLTGNYPDRHGTAVSNSFGFFNSSGSVGFSSSFAYWTNKLSTGAYIMVDESGNNAPAPWTAYTRAGCDVGNVAVANTVFENTKSDVLNVFGNPSPECTEANCTGGAALPVAVADFEGIAIHCAQNSPICAGPNGRPDVLPDATYSGYRALFGHKYAIPVVNGGSTTLTDLAGGTVKDRNGNIGFPGFDGMFPKVTGAYAAKMLEAGVQVVVGYMSDAHDNHSGASNVAFGPGEAGYVQQLKDYDAGFAAFFAELAAHGIDKSNTLFVFTADEGDHFVGGKPSPAMCDGVNVPCTYSQIGEINGDISRLLLSETGSAPIPFSVHSDVAPNVYVNGNPAANDASVRKLEHDMANLTAFNPLLNDTIPLFVAFADRAEMKLLHMVTGDPGRTPSFSPFAYPDYFLTSSSTPTACTQPNFADCVFESPAFAWNHGTIAKSVATTWRGLVGPGVAHKALDVTWTDHTDLRPSILMLAGIQPDYVHDGRPVVEHMTPSAPPMSILAHRDDYTELASAYKQLTAPFGTVGMASLTIATDAVMSTSRNDKAYNRFVSRMTDYTNRRDAVAKQIRAFIDGVSFHHAVFNDRTADQLTRQANALIQEMRSWAASSDDE